MVCNRGRCEIRAIRNAIVVATCVVLGILEPGTIHGQRFSSVASAVQSGIRRGVYPGAVVLIGRKDSILYSKGFGRFTWARGASHPVPDSTLWDLASLTKVVATMSSALVLVDRGQLNLDTTVASVVPGFGQNGKEAVTIRMLLNHTSGLPRYEAFYQEAHDREGVLSRLLEEPLRYPPGTRDEYSDLNAILLGLVLERVTGRSLADLARETVFQPLGMSQTRFTPPASLHYRIAPTGKRHGEPIVGVVNDQNAAVLGGVSGHAGLFSTARDLARFAQVWLRQGQLRDGPWVSRTTLMSFLQRSPTSGTRVLGWDTPDSIRKESVFGALASGKAYGHTGWTGTELWIDPDKDLFLVFLTNRSFDPRIRRSIGVLKTVRNRLSDAVIAAVGPSCRKVVVAGC